MAMIFLKGVEIKYWFNSLIRFKKNEESFNHFKCITRYYI